MSVNFYVAWPGGVEGEAYREEVKLHVGKTSGPRVSLQAYLRSSELPSDWDEIRSWNDWERTLATHPGFVIYDEYLRVMTFDELRTWLMETTPAGRGSSYNYAMQHRGELGIGDGSEYWLDENGFSMIARNYF
jgi:hypothetical protein